jgi:hypothetical protein
MLRTLTALFLLAVAAFAANVRLYLKDGTSQIVREYKVEGDRVRYYSVERSEWEEVPLSLVDLAKTEAEVKQRKAALEEEAKVVSAEEKVEREQRDELARVPLDPGVYLIDGKDVKAIKQAEAKAVTDKKRAVLKVLSPAPVFAGKATLEVDGEHSANLALNDHPEFYIRLASEDRFGILRVKSKKNLREVERWNIHPIVKDIILRDQDEVEVFRQQVADGLYKIWPREPLAPGEYAVVEFTEGKGNTQVWDFAWRPPANH